MRAVRPYIISKTYRKKITQRILFTVIGVTILSGGVIGYFYIKDLFKNKDTPIGVSQSYPQQQKESTPSPQSLESETAIKESKPSSISDTTPPLVSSTIPESGDDDTLTPKEIKQPITSQSTSKTKESVSQKGVSNCFASVSPDRWKGEYYNNKDLSGNPSMIRDDGDGFLCFNQRHWNPDNIKGIVANNISVRWTRTVYFDGIAHQFTVKSNEGFKLYVDDELILDWWLNRSLATFTSVIKPSTGNHIIKIEYHIISGGTFFELLLQALSTPEQSTVQRPLTVNISGEWEGKVNNKPAKLSIAQDGNSLKGNIYCNNVKEFLSGEINNDSIVLRGTYYFAKKGTGFSLDTFSGTISSQDGDFIRGNYTDEDGNSGEWFVKRVLVTSSPASQQINPQNTEATNGDIQLSGEWEGVLADKPIRLSITQDGNFLSGRMENGNRKENLSGEIKKDWVVLGGNSGSFNGTVVRDRNSMGGQYSNISGDNVRWFVKRVLVTSSPASQQINPQNTEATNGDIQLSGEWEGVLADKPIRLSITQDGNFLSGRMENGNRKENLSGEIKKDWVVLGGNSGSFNGTVTRDRNSMGGQYSNISGDNVRWFVKRVLVTSSPDLTSSVSKKEPIINLLSEDEVKIFIEKWVNLRNKKGSINEIMQLYADKVDYQDKGYLTKDIVKQSIIDFQKMWSDVEYKFVSPIKVSSDNANDKKKAKFTLHKISRNDQVTAESDMKLNLTLYKQENSIVIIKENLTEKKIVTNISYQLRKLSKRLQKGTHITIITGRGQPTVFYTKLEQVSSDTLKIYMHHRFDEGGFGSLNDLISCEWSSSALSFVGVWDNKKNMQIYLKPEYDSSGYIKSFDGYIEGGRNNSRFELGLYPNLLSF